MIWRRWPGRWTRRDRKSAAQDDSIDTILQLAMGVMMAVCLTGILEGADDETLSHAGKIACGEVKALLNGEGEYGEALQGVASDTVSEAHAMSLVVATCVWKIAAFMADR